ncbi:glycosyltransferase, partial [Actimicrobium sp. CCI2.3]
SHGIHTAITMPPPVIISKPIDSQSIFDLNTLALNTTRDPSMSDVKKLGDVLQIYDDSVVFFSIFNPYDYRKQVQLMLPAFMLALEKNINMILIIKLVIDNIHTTLGTIQDILKKLFKIEGQCDRIIFIGEKLSDHQVIKIMETANYYLCTSSTEGLNLPLIEAMAQGVVPVSSRATAMADYINETNSVIIESERAVTNGTYHFLHGQLVTTHFPPILLSIVDALIVASSLSKEAYQSLSSQAKIDVDAKYSLSAFVNKLNAIGGV